MRLSESPTAEDSKRRAMSPAMAALASGRLGARIVRVAQVASAIHAAEAVNRAQGASTGEARR